MKNQTVQTPTQSSKPSQEDILCKICYKYAMNGVICKNQKCSILFCESCATDAIQKIGNKCPYCRITPFKISESPNREKINKMQMICQFCQNNCILSEEQNHYKKKCQFFLKVNCEYCPERILPDLMVKHIRFKHENVIDQLIEKAFKFSSAIYEPKEVIQRNQVYLNKLGRSPNLGSSGKFYCGSKLQGPKCNCCNGYCGPSNGQNCSECMKLDLQRLGVKKGCLVNSSGNICWKKGDTFVCGVQNYPIFLSLFCICMSASQNIQIKSE